MKKKSNMVSLITPERYDFPVVELNNAIKMGARYFIDVSDVLGGSDPILVATRKPVTVKQAVRLVHVIG